MATVLGAAAAIFAVTLFSEPAPPFSPGGTLGMGVLVEAGLWLLAVRLRTSGWSVLLPVAGVAIAVALGSAGPQPWLWGVLIATALAWCLLAEHWPEAPPAALTVFALSAAFGLAWEAPAPKGIAPAVWHLGPLAVAAAGTLAVIGGSFSAAPWWRQVVAALCTVAGALAAGQFFGFADLWQVALVALAAAALATFVGETGLALFAWIGLFALVFATERGYGTAMAAAMLGFVTLAVRGGANLTTGTALVTLAALFRLFVETYPLRAPRADLYTHTALLGLLLAIVGLANLALWCARAARPAPWRLLVAGFWAAAAPLALTTLWGVRAAAGWLGGGLALALALLTLPTTGPLAARTLPLVFAGAAATLPLAALAEAFSDGTRTARLGVLAVLGVQLVGTLAAAWLAERSRRPPTAPLGTLADAE
jgi:hypothetical protein